MTLGGSAVTAGSANAIATSASPATGVQFTLTSAPYVMTSPVQVTLSSASSNTGVTFAIVGLDATGGAVAETLAGPAAGGIVYSANIYQQVLAVFPTVGSATSVSVGYSTVYSPALPTKINLFSPANASAGRFTIVGTNPNGQLSTETALAGPTNGIIQSVNTYASVCSVLCTTTASASISIGNPAIVGGVSIVPMAGDF